MCLAQRISLDSFGSVTHALQSQRTPVRREIAIRLASKGQLSGVQAHATASNHQATLQLDGVGTLVPSGLGRFPRSQTPETGKTEKFFF